MKKLTIRTDTEGNWICRCGNTFEQEGFEDVKADQLFGIYLAVCNRCGRKFDDQTLELVGVRLSRDYHNELIPKDELAQIAKQSHRYFAKRMKGIIRP